MPPPPSDRDKVKVMEPSDGYRALSLMGRRVRLRPMTKEDLPLLFQWRNDTSSLFLWSSQGRLLSLPMLIQEIEADEAGGDIRLIIENTRGEVIGLVFTRGCSQLNRHCYIGLYLTPEERGCGYGAEAGALFLWYLFTYLGMEKVYATVYEFNSFSRRLIEKAGFCLEGTFPQHHWWRDRLWTLHQFALYRRELPRIEEFLLRLQSAPARRLSQEKNARG